MLAFAALSDEDVGVAGVGVAPAQVGPVAGGPARGWLGWFEAPITNMRSGPNWASIGLAQEA